MNSIRISVVMTTYNGAKYVERQLESLLNQTRIPDEVVICDDQSSDGTARIVEEYIDSHNLSNWSILRNADNLGWKNNFYEAAKKVTGDIIFFCDQDDIWLPHKVEKMAEIMEEKSAGCVYGECTIIDADDQSMEERMLRNDWTGDVEQLFFDSRFNTQVTLGCRMCVSRDILEKYIELEMPACGHDTQCGRLAMLYSTFWHLDEPVIQYRIHASNSSGIVAAGSFGRAKSNVRTQGIADNVAWLKKIIEKNDLSDERIQILEFLVDMQERRYAYLSGGKGTVFGLLKFRNCYSSKSMLLGDFAYRHRINKLAGSLKWKLEKAKR